VPHTRLPPDFREQVPGVLERQHSRTACFDRSDTDVIFADRVSEDHIEVSQHSLRRREGLTNLDDDHRALTLQ